MEQITIPGTDVVRRAVQRQYAKIAVFPGRQYNIHVGVSVPGILGYPDEEVASLPEPAVESFCGVAYPFWFGPLMPGQTVVDIGCGSGVDALLAARQVGKEGRVIGVDMTPEILSKARAAVSKAQAANVELRGGYAEELPLEDGVADVVISNGVINHLCRDKELALAEAFRVLVPGGRLLLADVVVQKPMGGASTVIDLWTN